MGDYGSTGKFSGLLTPDFNVGVGKWFTPGIGAKLQFGLSNSRGYSKEQTIFAYGDPLTDDDGNTYWKTKNKWWDLNVNAMFNLSRLFKGYEGKDSEDLKNQFIASVGIGAVHHRAIDAQRNEWSGHLELQYSRFFSAKKNISLDVKARAVLFQTNFDAITLKSTGENSKWFDSNLGLSVGVTYYFKKRHWDRCEPCQSPVYINKTIVNPAPVSECPEYKTLVFYVFFPNNYSGRNDAPIVADASVNAIDYLASGIFTQRKFDDAEAVASRLASGASLASLATSDVATEKASRCTPVEGVARGYEMSAEPISLPMEAAAMNAFKGKMGYYYAPMYKGSKTWYYRVDEETTAQTLLSADNYKESESYALNAHAEFRLGRVQLFAVFVEQYGAKRIHIRLVRLVRIRTAHFYGNGHFFVAAREREFLYLAAGTLTARVYNGQFESQLALALFAEQLRRHFQRRALPVGCERADEKPVRQNVYVRLRCMKRHSPRYRSAVLEYERDLTTTAFERTRVHGQSHVAVCRAHAFAVREHVYNAARAVYVYKRVRRILAGNGGKFALAVPGRFKGQSDACRYIGGHDLPVFVHFNGLHYFPSSS